MKPETKRLIRGFRVDASEHLGVMDLIRGCDARKEHAGRLRLFHATPPSPQQPQINRNVFVRMVRAKG